MKHRNYLFVVFLIFGLLLAACGGTAAPTEEPVATEEPMEQVTPSVTVEDQDATGGTVTIADVDAADPGWIVIHVDQDGAPGAVIGHAAVEAGHNENVEVEIDLEQATPTLYAMLHLDAASVGEYDFPGDDVPVKVDDAIVVVPFTVTLPAMEQPSVSVSDQDASDGKVVIDEVVAADPGWLVIHITQNGGPGPVIGYAPVEAGTNADVEVDIDLEQATPQLFAMLHLDAAAEGEYEFPGDDVPVSVDDSIVNVPFNVTLPDYQLSVTVSDQESSGVVVIDEIKADGPSWIVVHADNNGAPGAVIGHASVGVGVNTEVEVEIDLEQATPILYAMLHVDAGSVGEYEFPGDDAPAREGDQIVVVPFNVTYSDAAASSGNTVTVLIEDTFFEEKTVTVPVGTTVVWVQQGGLPHTVTSDDGLFDSGALSGGESFSYTFTDPGTYAYHCQLHGASGGSGMAGTIIVTEQ